MATSGSRAGATSEPAGRGVGYLLLLNPDCSLAGSVLTPAIESVLAPDQVGIVELILVDNGNPH